MICRLPAANRLNIFCVGIFVLFLLQACAGCQNVSVPTSNPLNNSPNLSDDLTSLLKEQAKTTLYEPTYRTVGDSKSGFRGFCEFKAFPQNINAIANAFDMTEIKDDKTLKYIHYDEKNSKLGASFVQQTTQGADDVRAYGVFGKPAKLKCKSGKAFDYMIIFYKPVTNEATIETLYASG